MTTLRDLGELGVLRRLLPFLAGAGGDLAVGAGEDDVAVWRSDGEWTVATCDSFVEGVHFDLGWADAETAGWRAAALTLADLAAKAVRPRFGLVTLAAPGATGAPVVEALYRGLDACARATGLRLAGGDTSSTGGPITLTVFAVGSAPEPPRPRSAVQAGWRFGVTGPLGGESAALAARRPTRPLPYGFDDHLGNGVRADISDGLVRELVKFAGAAGVGARLRAADVPVAEGASPAQALAGGEEVHMLWAWPEGEPAPVPAIGEFTAPREIVIVDADGRERPAGGGHDHFA